MHLTNGCESIIRMCRSSVTPTMPSVTERAKRTRASFGSNWKDDEQNVSWNCQFDFLGYTFRPRRVTDRMGKRFVGFVPAISDKAAKAMRQEMRRDGVL